MTTQKTISKLEKALDRQKSKEASKRFKNFCEYVIKDEKSGKKITMSDLQDSWIRHITFCMKNGLHCMILAPMSCQLRGERVRMADGSTKAVEDVVVGDKLMGGDSTPRTVLETHSGKAKYATINTYKGKISYKVTMDHILTLVDTLHDNKLVDMTVEEFLGLSKWRQTGLRLLHTGYELPERDVPLDPYILGLYLGDGGSTNSRFEIWATDNEVMTYVRNWASNERLPLHEEDQTREGANVPLSRLSVKGDMIRNSMNELGLFGVTGNDKFIPDVYKRNSRDVRMKVLAGLIDTDGSRSAGGSIDFINKSKTLAQDVYDLARSLGMFASISTCKKRATNSSNQEYGVYYRVYISPDRGAIPVQIARKQWQVSDSTRNIALSGFTVTREEGLGEYFGFMLDGDHRYLTEYGHLFHNSGKTQIISVALPLYLIGRDPNCRIKLVCLSDDSAKERLGSIKEYIENDEDYRNVFPGVIPDKNKEWSAHRLFVKRDAPAKDATLDAKGVLASGIGGRCDYLLVDDIFDENTAVAQPAKRDQINRTYRSVWLSRIEPKGTAIVIMTRWHERDLAGELLADKTMMSRYAILVQSVAEDFSCLQMHAHVPEKYRDAYSKFCRGYTELQSATPEEDYIRAELAQSKDPWDDESRTSPPVVE